MTWPQNFGAALGLATIAGACTALGALFCIFGRRPGRRLLAASMGFSAGIMLMIAFGCMLPEAEDVLGGDGALVALLGGLLLMLVIDATVPHEWWIGTQTSPGHDRVFRAGALAAVGIGIHNFPEGVAVFAGGLQDLHLGVALALAIGLHNIPEGMAIAVPIYAATGSRRKALGWSTMAGAVEPLAALLTGLLLSRFVSPVVVGGTIAVAAGFMVYVALDELLPAAQTEKQGHLAILGVILGMAVMVGGMAVLRHVCPLRPPETPSVVPVAPGHGPGAAGTRAAPPAPAADASRRVTP